MNLTLKNGKEFKKFSVNKEDNVFSVKTINKKENNSVQSIENFNIDFISKNSLMFKSINEELDLNYYLNGNKVILYLKGKEYEFDFLDEKLIRRLNSNSALNNTGTATIEAPMPGKIVKINFKKGDFVKKGTTILIMEAMKMENEMKAPYDGHISDIFVNSEEVIEAGSKLFSID